MRLASLIHSLVYFYEVLIMVWCILSWVPRSSGGLIDDISQVLSSLVEPYLGLFRRIIPPVGGIDFSPVVAMLVLGIVEDFLVRLLA